METIEGFKVHYNWTEEDEKNLRRIACISEKYKEEFVEEFYRYLENFPDAGKYLSSKEVRDRHEEKIKRWFVSLFTSNYDAQYLKGLYGLGEDHLNIGLPLHYVQALISFVRSYVMNIVNREMGISAEASRILISVNKALDINLDVMINSFREEELRLYHAMGNY